jgi:hypothetical protein
MLLLTFVLYSPSHVILYKALLKKALIQLSEKVFAVLQAIEIILININIINITKMSVFGDVELRIVTFIFPCRFTEIFKRCFLLKAEVVPRRFLTFLALSFHKYLLR